MPNKKIKHPEFAQRMQQACDGNPDVPPQNYGRLGWFVKQLEDRYGESSTIETARKWLAGESRPRQQTMRRLAEILKVDESWLALGHSVDVPIKERRLRKYTADGAVNLVAGIVQMSGWTPAFPEDEAGVDLLAIIRGAAYRFNIVTGIHEKDDWYFHVPSEALGCFLLGVVRDAEFTFRFFELDRETIEEHGKRKSGYYEVSLSQHNWRPITSFADRL